jgi:hypothetical protein
VQAQGEEAAAQGEEGAEGEEGQEVKEAQEGEEQQKAQQEAVAALRLWLRQRLKAAMMKHQNA